MKIASKTSTHHPDYVFIATFFVILVFGLFMLASASTAVAYQRFQDNYFYIKHQLLYGALPGLVIFLIASKVNYKHWKKLALPGLILAIILLIAVFIPGLGFAYGGASRWIKISTFIFQPSEMVKLAFIVYLASWLEKRTEKGLDLSYGFLPFLLVLGVISFLIILQPDVGTMIIIGATAILVYWVAGGKLTHLLSLSLLGAGLFALLIKIAPYRANRLTVFLHPDQDPLGIGYHIKQALIAVGSGGWFGVGLGLSRQKYRYLPEVIGDSIFAIIAEELGFIVCVLLIGAFFLLVHRGFKIAKSAPDNFGRYLASGICAWVGCQVVINIGAMIGIMPLTGLPLPFISYGSSSLISLMLSMGIVVNISRQTG